MNCRDVKALLHAYADGELDLTGSLEVERHLSECPDCALFLQNLRTLHTGLKSQALYHRAPVELAGKLQKALRQEARSQEQDQYKKDQYKKVEDRAENKIENRVRRNRWVYAGLAATTALAVVLLLVLLPTAKHNGTEEADISSELNLSGLSKEVVACHVRSLMVHHIMDVVSTDRHTVKPWFNGKLDYAPPVIDLKSRGFPLIGGRLDYLDERPVTVMVYTRQKHTINLFVWPLKRPMSYSRADETKEIRLTTHQGYHLCHWVQSDLQYWAISDLNSMELQNFARFIRDEVKNTP